MNRRGRARLNCSPLISNAFEPNAPPQIPTTTERSLLIAISHQQRSVGGVSSDLPSFALQRGRT
jgi:hypothetical protein